jgi:hypothetical protein
MVMDVGFGLAVTQQAIRASGWTAPDAPTYVQDITGYHATAKTISIAKMSPAAGDIGIIMIKSEEITAETWTYDDDDWQTFATPHAGWENSTNSCRMFYRVMDGTETSGSWTFTVSVGVAMLVTGALFRGVDPKMPFGGIVFQNYGLSATTSQALKTLVSPVANCLSVCLVTIDNDPNFVSFDTPPTGYTTNFADTESQFWHGLFTKTVADADTTVDPGTIAWTGSEQIMYAHILLQPDLQFPPPELVCMKTIHYDDVTTATINVPQNHGSPAAGMLGVLLVGCDGDPLTAPTGWTTLYNDDHPVAGDIDMGIFYKFLTSGEVGGSDIDVGVSPAEELDICLMVFDTTATPLVGTVATGVDASIEITGLTTTSVSSLVLCVAVADGEQYVTQANENDYWMLLHNFFETVDTNTNLIVAMRRYETTSTVVPTTTWSILGAQDWMGIMLEIPND